MRITKRYIAAALLVVLSGAAVGVEHAGSRPTAQPKQATRYQVDCSISPDLCMTDPVARGCGEGRHWSSAGSGFAHCVEDDRNCADGKPGQRDEYDNLVCADEKAAGEGVAREEGPGSAAGPQDQQEKEKTQ